MIQQILFVLVTGVIGFIAFKKYRAIYETIQLGKTIVTDKKDKTLRWQNVALVAFGQKKMFKRIIPAVLHLCIYVAFLMTQVELIEMLIDGLTGIHRVFAPILGALYSFIINFIEVLSLLALIATIVFLYRRNVIKLKRLNLAEMKGWPHLDANLILFGEIILVTGIFTMNAADGLLQNIDPSHYPSTGKLYLSSIVGQMFANFEVSTLMGIERFGWWLHYLAVLGFIVYLPMSKHLHIFLAFFNVYFADLKPRGQIVNMPEIQKEVRVMMGLEAEETGEMGDLPEFGAKDIFDMSQRTLLGAMSCTECGRCTSVCPANITGKKLSPRKIMMSIRDRMEDVNQMLAIGSTDLIDETKKEDAATLSKDNFNDGKSLFDYISREEIHACTSCNACVEACPIMIDPLAPIIELRRYEILTESAGPTDWLPMFNSLESSSSPWAIPDARDQWATNARKA